MTPPPANDDRPVVIISTTSKKRLKQLRAEGRSSQRYDPEAAAEMRAWLKRAKCGHGPSR